MAEQRKHHRVPVSFNVTCILDETDEFEGVARDLSVGGLFVESERVLAFGTPITILATGLAARELRWWIARASSGCRPAWKNVCAFSSRWVTRFQNRGI